MKTKEYYTVLVPLINLILTGSKEVVVEGDCIKLSEGYKFSMQGIHPTKPIFHKLT
ncbi:hypothetical protein [Myroides sp. LoEW2-1]|uniref:hypothetical protein n=1 Tax=Myroides sp. LoEW2-1 TaxID=2683192 RepID=UPI001325A2D7|nr:hypothetical protein [Myroides sp. LoEW2-1]MVX37003.1 hypothetical protein [Myroides sp. LoEW2-1]